MPRLGFRAADKEASEMRSTAQMTTNAGHRAMELTCGGGCCAERFVAWGDRLQHACTQEAAARRASAAAGRARQRLGVGRRRIGLQLARRQIVTSRQSMHPAARPGARFGGRLATAWGSSHRQGSVGVAQYGANDNQQHLSVPASNDNNNNNNNNNAAVAGSTERAGHSGRHNAGSHAAGCGAHRKRAGNGSVHSDAWMWCGSWVSANGLAWEPERCPAI